MGDITAAQKVEEIADAEIREGRAVAVEQPQPVTRQGGQRTVIREAAVERAVHGPQATRRAALCDCREGGRRPTCAHRHDTPPVTRHRHAPAFPGKANQVMEGYYALRVSRHA